MSALQAQTGVAESGAHLEAGPQQVNDHDVVVPLYAIPSNIGDANYDIMRRDPVRDTVSYCLVAFLIETPTSSLQNFV